MSAPSRILYVDNDKDSCDLAGALLKYSDLRCTVISAESAKEARLLIVKDLFDLYIFDSCLPEISGIELCRCVRRFDLITPVLFFSATARPADIAEAIEAGADEYLTKPDDLEKLSLTVKRLLDKALQAQSRQSIIENRDVLKLEVYSEQILHDKLQPRVWKHIQEISDADSLKTQPKRFSGTNNEIREKRFNQNQIQTDRFGKLRVQRLLTVAAIFAIIVIQFVSQGVYFQPEKIASGTEAASKQIFEIKSENEPSANVKTEDETGNLDNGTMPDTVVPPESKFVPSRTVIKKKESRESNAERLRRAERILTGI